MKIKRLDGGFGGIRKKGDPKPAKSEKTSRVSPQRVPNSAAVTAPTTDYPAPPPPDQLKSKGTNLKQALTPQYVGYVERSLVPILERMGFEGDRLNLKKINNIKGLYSEVINSKPGNDMATAYAYLAVLLTWHGVTPDPNAMDDQPPEPPKEEVKPSQRAYYRERLAICSECPEAFETLGRIRCGQCKCFMELKAFLKNSRCPLRKW